MCLAQLQRVVEMNEFVDESGKGAIERGLRDLTCAVECSGKQTRDPGNGSTTSAMDHLPSATSAAVTVATAARRVPALSAPASAPSATSMPNSSARTRLP